MSVFLFFILMQGSADIAEYEGKIELQPELYIIY